MLCAQKQNLYVKCRECSTAMFSLTQKHISEQNSGFKHKKLKYFRWNNGKCKNVAKNALFSNAGICSESFLH